MAETLTRDTTAAEQQAAQADLNHDRRRRGIYGLVGVCVGFFVVAIGASYIAAAAYGYGSGFGDGKDLAQHTKPDFGGQGFFGDSALLVGGVLIDALIMFVWYLAASRMDNASADDPVAPDEVPVDLNDDASWYAVQVPRLTKNLMIVAWVCLVCITIGVSAVAPVVIARFGGPL